MRPGSSSLVTLRVVLLGSALAAGCDASSPATDDAASPDAAAVDCTSRPLDAPSPRGEVAGVLDEARGRIVVYGGNTAAPVDCVPMYDLVDELWAFHLDCGTWEQLSVSGGPGVRARHAVTLDTRRNEMLLFGGRLRTTSYTNFNDVWAFDLVTDAWRQIETTGGPPDPRSSAIVQYDAARDRMILFGGNSSTSGLTLEGMEDTWTLDLSTHVWTRIEGEGPPPRLFHASALAGDRLYVFGGTPSFDGPFYADTWVLDLTTDTWSELATSGETPESRFGSEAFFDAASGRLVVFGGHDGTSLGNRNDVHVLDVATGVWSIARAGDTPSGAAAGACDFPADFTTPEDGAPERRYAFLATQDATHGYVFGGKTDCGVVNDVVALDFATSAWETLRVSTGGEACNRTGRLDCSTLCY